MGDFDHRCGLPVARVAAPAAALGTGLRRYDLFLKCVVFRNRCGANAPSLRRRSESIALGFVFPSNAMRSSRSAQSRVPDMGSLFTSSSSAASFRFPDPVRGRVQRQLLQERAGGADDLPGRAVHHPGPGVLENLAAGLFILPFFLFSATSGQLADKYEKSRLIRFTKLLEIGIMVLAAVAFALKSLPLMLSRCS